MTTSLFDAEATLPAAKKWITFYFMIKVYKLVYCILCFLIKSNLSNSWFISTFIANYCDDCFFIWCWNNSPNGKEMNDIITPFTFCFMVKLYRLVFCILCKSNVSNYWCITTFIVPNLTSTMTVSLFDAETALPQAKKWMHKYYLHILFHG